MLNLKINLPIKTLENIQDYLIKKEIRLIIFGETHGFFNDLELQDRIIQIAKPKYYLYEMLENKTILSKEDYRDILSNDDKAKFSIISTFGEIKPAIKMARDNNLKIIGCDIANMGRLNDDFLKKTDLTKQEEQEEYLLMNKREKFQAQKIIEILEKNEGILFISLGAYHLRKESIIWGILSHFNPIVCYPTLNGKQEFGPVEDMKEEDVLYILDSCKNYLK